MRKTCLMCMILFLSVLNVNAAFAQAEKYLVGEKAPEIDVVEWINSDPLTLGELKGKIVILDFWATWSISCRVSLPHIQELYAKYKPEGVVILSLTRERKIEYIENFVKKNEMKNPIGISDTTESKYGVKNVPAAVIIDREGKVYWQGKPMEGLKESLERLLEN
ncbi:MAG: TlpA family protein disulfide reductase [Candidatus Aureabacteria bacterium]|nr:TlpA family protein disulfide reductase [Candidatus Auribacterota bacterium]